MPALLLSRLLALLAGSALAGVSPVDVPEPASVIVTSLIEDNAHWIGVLGAVSENTVTVSLSAAAAPWRLDQPLPERVDRLAVYDGWQGSWRLATVPGQG